MSKMWLQSAITMPSSRMPRRSATMQPQQPQPCGFLDPWVDHPHHRSRRERSPKVPPH